MSVRRGIFFFALTKGKFAVVYGLRGAGRGVLKRTFLKLIQVARDGKTWLAFFFFIRTLL